MTQTRFDLGRGHGIKNLHTIQECNNIYCKIILTYIPSPTSWLFKVLRHILLEIIIIKLLLDYGTLIGHLAYKFLSLIYI